MKIGLFALLLLSAVGAWAASNVNGKTFYLQTGLWNSNDAWFQMYCFKDGGSANYWVTMKNVCGDLYVGTAPTSGDYNRVIFVRRAPNTDGNNWNNVWNQTANLNPSNSNNKYDITGWSSGMWYNHSPALPRGTYIYFDNSQTKWSKVWMSEVCGCNNRDRNADDYKPKEDCYWYQMEQYCGSIYRVKLAQDAYYGSFSFFAGDQSGYVVNLSLASGFSKYVFKGLVKGADITAAAGNAVLTAGDEVTDIDIIKNDAYTNAGTAVEDVVYTFAPYSATCGDVEGAEFTVTVHVYPEVKAPTIKF